MHPKPSATSITVLHPLAGSMPFSTLSFHSRQNRYDNTKKHFLSWMKSSITPHHSNCSWRQEGEGQQTFVKTGSLSCHGWRSTCVMYESKTNTLHLNKPVPGSFYCALCSLMQLNGTESRKYLFQCAWHARTDHQKSMCLFFHYQQSLISRNEWNTCVGRSFEFLWWITKNNCMQTGQGWWFYRVSLGPCGGVLPLRSFFFFF